MRKIALVLMLIILLASSALLVSSCSGCSSKKNNITVTFGGYVGYEGDILVNNEIPDQTVKKGGFAQKPSPDPVDLAGMFLGWSLSAEKDSRDFFDFENTKIEETITLYAVFMDYTVTLGAQSDNITLPSAVNGEQYSRQELGANALTNYPDGSIRYSSDKNINADTGLTLGPSSGRLSGTPNVSIPSGQNQMTYVFTMKAEVTLGSGIIIYSAPVTYSLTIVTGKIDVLQSVKLNKSSFIYGDRLNTEILVTTTESGTIEFDDDGAVLDAGTHEMNWTFTPYYNAQNYKNTSGKISVVIGQATPTVENIVVLGGPFSYGDALPELSGDKSVEGTLRLIETQQLQTGNFEYDWEFIPDSANYKRITGKTQALEVLNVRIQVDVSFVKSPAEIMFMRDALSDSWITATKTPDIAGTLKFVSGQLLEVGTKPYNWEFIPSDSGYNTEYGQIELTVVAFRITLIQEDFKQAEFPSLTFGDSLPKTQNVIKEGFDLGYYTVTGELTAGTKDYVLTFVPKEGVNVEGYGTDGTDTVSLTVLPKKITNSDITVAGGTLRYGDALPNISAAAFADFGTLVWNQTTIDYVGDKFYGWTFTSNNSNYADADGTLQLNAVKANPLNADPSQKAGDDGKIYFLDTKEAAKDAITVDEKVEGEFSFKADTEFRAGVKTYYWSFVPGDTINYETITDAPITITVSKLIVASVNTVDVQSWFTVQWGDALDKLTFGDSPYVVWEYGKYTLTESLTFANNSYNWIFTVDAEYINDIGYTVSAGGPITLNVKKLPVYIADPEYDYLSSTDILQPGDYTNPANHKIKTTTPGVAVTLDIGQLAIAPGPQLFTWSFAGSDPANCEYYYKDGQSLAAGKNDNKIWISVGAQDRQEKTDPEYVLTGYAEKLGEFIIEAFPVEAKDDSTVWKYRVLGGAFTTGNSPWVTPEDGFVVFKGLDDNETYIFEAWLEGNELYKELSLYTAECKINSVEYYYRFNATGETLVKYTEIAAKYADGGSGKFTLEKNPSTNATITAIGDGAFENNKSLKEVTIRDGITSIGNNAFAGCDKLMYVYIDRMTVPSLGTNIFGGCDYLLSGRGAIFVPNNTTYLAYAGVKSALGIAWNGNKGDSGEGEVLYSYDWLATASMSVLVGNGVNKTLNTITGFSANAPAVVTAVKTPNIVSANFPAIGAVGNGAFNDKFFPGGSGRSGSMINTIVLGNGMEALGFQAFRNGQQTSLKFVLLPATVTYLGEMALAGGSGNNGQLKMCFLGTTVPYAQNWFVSVGAAFWAPDADAVSKFKAWNNGSGANYGTNPWANSGFNSAVWTAGGPLDIPL